MRIYTGGAPDAVPIEWQELHPDTKTSEMSPRDISAPTHGSPWPELPRRQSEPDPLPPPPPPPAEPDLELLRERLRSELRRQLEAELRPALEAQARSHFEPRLDAARREGQAEGRASALAELEDQFNALAHAVESTAMHRARLRHEAERDVVHLALAIARRILRRQILVDDESLLGLVKAALENTALREVTEIRLHPRFAPKIEGYLRTIGAPNAIRVTPDGSLEAGAVLVETARGTLDASLDSQLDEISRGLADQLAASPRRP